MAGGHERELLTFPSGGRLSGVQAATEASYLVAAPSLTALQSDNTVGGPHGTLDITSLRITLESPTQIWACLVFSDSRRDGRLQVSGVSAWQASYHPALSQLLLGRRGPSGASAQLGAWVSLVSWLMFFFSRV